MSSFTTNNRLVESHSVQSQFAALTRDRDRLRWEVDSADRQRRQQEGNLAELRTLQTSLSQQLQTAHASLGAFQKQKALVKHEEARLSTLLETERKELLEAQDKLQRLLETQKQSKESYLQQMHEWNDELEQLVCQAEQQEWKRCISTETIAMIPPNLVDMTNAKALWDEAIHKKHDAEEKHNKLMQELDQLRAHAQKQQPDLDWNQLEQTWEQTTASNNVSVSLFYGTSANPAESSEEPQEQMGIPVMS